MSESILQSVKEGLLIVDTYDAFDGRILVVINTVMNELWQATGYPKAKDFQVEDATTTWDELITEKRFSMIKSFVIERVTLMFDPPSSSYALEQMKNDCDELLWRIKAEVDTGEDKT